MSLRRRWGQMYHVILHYKRFEPAAAAGVAVGWEAEATVAENAAGPEAASAAEDVLAALGVRMASDARQSADVGAWVDAGAGFGVGADANAYEYANADQYHWKRQHSGTEMGRSGTR